ncbi:tetratricopeptide repeat protein [Sphingomonas sp.]|uniref:O-linked N-acetylglucosamine transferase, SPINDLY family protein n=1 Tax=Sphingomonas sp. TaxID=28214 RepID=UPI003B3A3BF0
MRSDPVRTAIAQGTQFHQAGRLAEARHCYERALQIDPRQPDAINLLGMIDYAAGDHARAIGRIRAAIAINPRVPGFHTNLGTVLQAGGDPKAAEAAFRAALALKPDHLAALYNLGVVLQALGDIEAAAATYQAALRLDPRLGEVWNNLGTCQVRMGQTKAALESFARAIQSNPHSAAAHINAAGLLLTTGALDEAERIARQVIARDPRQAEAHYHLGLVMMKRDRFGDAAAAFRAALAVKADYPDAALQLGLALFELGERDAAIACYRALIARAPDHAAARLALLVATVPMMTGSAAESQQVAQHFMAATADLDDWAGTHPGRLAAAIGTVQPFLLAYRPADLTQALARFGRLISREASSQPRPPRADRVVQGRARVRLGIVSGHVRSHPVWQIILRGMIAALDRERFDLRLYETGPLRDAETEWAERQVDHVQRPLRSAEAWAEHIRQDAPDMLFYPEVGMDPVAGALAPLRLAPLQMASWGHPVSTGLPTIDLYLSGDAIEPADADAHYSEQLIRLPGTGVLTRFEGGPPEAWRGPAREANAVRFALCQQPMKFDPADDALYARIAQEIGEAQFWIVRSRKYPWASERLIQRLAATFVAHGLDPTRHLRSTDWMGPAAFSGFLDAMDVMLDCPAFSGYTTAWQAIHRGTPIVTLEGRFLRQRLAAGLLRQIGWTDGIAGDADQYVAMAVEQGVRSRTGVDDVRRRLAGSAARADDNVEAIRAMERVLLAG